MSATERAAQLLGDLAQCDVEIAHYTTYKLGGPAKLFVEARDENTLQHVRQAVMETHVPTLVIGKGSNMLVSDDGFDGLVVTLAGEFTAIEFDGTKVKAGAAVSLPVLARKSAAEGFTGFEWAVGVPGSLGGAVRMNAGGHGSQMGECLYSIKFVDLLGGDDGTREAAWLALTYRNSRITSHQIVTWATLDLRPGNREASESEISDIVKWRRENQPGGRNAGSVFTNPEGRLSSLGRDRLTASPLSAGGLIEAAGMKGVEIRSATVSPKHANFIQSSEGGTASDVLELMKQVREAVKADSGVVLRPEVRLIGFSAAELEGLQ